MRLLLVNWQDRDNPQAGGAEIHLHEIFGRLAARGHDVTLLCGGWPGCDPTTTLDGIRVVRVGTRHTFPFLARRYFERTLASLREYVLISQKEPMVEVFLRQSDEKWQLSPVKGLDAVAQIHSLEVTLQLAEIYRGVEFPAQPPLKTLPS